jgi:hypothetical protein
MILFVQNASKAIISFLMYKILTIKHLEFAVNAVITVLHVNLTHNFVPPAKRDTKYHPLIHVLAK